jgi:hypothetical protein
MHLIASGNTTYLAWAQSISSIIGKRVSKQAVFERMNKAWVNTVKALVTEVIKKQAKEQIKHKLFRDFGDVWLHDSTTLNLPSLLFRKFKGVTVLGEKKATAKLNVIVNAVNGFCPVMSWTGYRTTEQQLAPDIMDIAKPKDLVIRDLGYFVLAVFKSMHGRGIYFLSRWRNKTNLYTIKEGKRINLRSLLRGKSHVDIKLLCGETERAEVRFVAIKLPVAVANERRRKAKADKHRNANHNELYYYLLGYAIYITNVEEDVWDYKQVAEAYAVRWQVEILFKSWKGAFCIDELIPHAVSNKERIESILYLIILYLTWYQVRVYEKVKDYSLKKTIEISVLQIAKWAFYNTARWLAEELTLKHIREILYYCRYDTRRRINAGLRFKQVFDS